MLLPLHMTQHAVCLHSKQNLVLLCVHSISTMPGCACTYPRQLLSCQLVAACEEHIHSSHPILQHVHVTAACDLHVIAARSPHIMSY